MKRQSNARESLTGFTNTPAYLEGLGDSQNDQELLILAVMLPTKREPGNDLPSPNMQTSIFEDLTLTVIPSRPRIL